MRILKNITALALCLAMLLCLAACGKAAEPGAASEAPSPANIEGAPVSSAQSQPGMRYIAESLPKPDGMAEVKAMAIDGGMLYAVDENLSLFSAELDSLSWTELDLDGAEGYPLSIAVGGGRLYLLAGKEKNAFEDDTFFIIYDLEAKTAQIAEKEPLIDGRAKSISFVQDKLLVLSDFGGLYEYSAEGEYVDICTPEDTYASSIAVVGDKPYITSVGQLCALNVDTLDLTPMFPVGEEYTSYFSYVSPDALLCVTGDSVTRLDAETGFAEPLFNWLDTGFAFYYFPPIGLTFTDDGEPIFADPTDGGYTV